MPTIKKGISTWLGLISAVLLAVKPLSEQLIALFENTSAEWSHAEKTSLLAGAIIAAVTIISRGIQAVAAILAAKGEDSKGEEV